MSVYFRAHHYEKIHFGITKNFFDVNKVFLKMWTMMVFFSCFFFYYYYCTLSQLVLKPRLNEMQPFLTVNNCYIDISPINADIAGNWSPKFCCCFFSSPNGNNSDPMESDPFIFNLGYFHFHDPKTNSSGCLKCWTKIKALFCLLSPTTVTTANNSGNSGFCCCFSAVGYLEIWGQGQKAQRVFRAVGIYILNIIFYI